MIQVTPEDIPAEDVPWWKELLGEDGGKGFGASLLIHIAILIALSLWVVNQESETVGLALNSSFQGVEGDTLTDIHIDSAIDDPGQDSASFTFTPIADPLSNAPSAAISESVTGFMSGVGTGVGDGGDGTLPQLNGINVPSYAKTKGSFSAWTEPRDPKPRENYFVVVQIRLPPELAAKIRKYPASRDLTLSVKGTDGWTNKDKNFQGNPQFPVKEGVVEVRIMIPGAHKLVRDEIFVKSKMLKETQEFEIEF